jgi:hypothetical protein
MVLDQIIGRDEAGQLGGLAVETVGPILGQACAQTSQQIEHGLDVAQTRHIGEGHWPLGQQGGG